MVARGFLHVLSFLINGDHNGISSNLLCFAFLPADIEDFKELVNGCIAEVNQHLIGDAVWPR